MQLINYSCHIIRWNGIERLGFQNWVLHTGMLFNSLEKWWPSQGKRPSEHEGLDICLFRDDNNNLHELVAPIQVPAAMEGVPPRDSKSSPSNPNRICPAS